VDAVEINEAGRRIVGEHWRLIVVFVLAGFGAAFLLVGGSKTYTASARLVLNTPDPTDRASAIAIADTGNALATSPAEVTRALQTAHITGRDGSKLAKRVVVRGLGTSGVLELSVTDKSRQVATAVANALALRIIQTRRDLSNGQTTRALARVDDQIATLDRRIIHLDESAAALPAGVARDAASRMSDALSQQRNALESSRFTLLTADAQRPQPQVISAAVAPSKPNASARVPDTILAGLLGLVLGLAIAGLLETIRPSIAGSDALAAEFDTPLIGSLSRQVSDVSDDELGPTAARLRLAAGAAAVDGVVLVGNGPNVVLEQLAERLEHLPSANRDAFARDTATGVTGNAGRPTITAIHDVAGRLEGVATGLVLVLPNKVKKADLRDVRYLMQITPFALVGLITYPRPALHRRLRRSHSSPAVGRARFESA
jgi:capsular polysaccharide biosynthesis protein